MYSRVYVEITNICNMHCSFCHGHSRAPRRMQPQEFSHVLDQLAGHTAYIYYHLMGEPLTHPDLPRFLEMAAKKQFRSVITTNGTLLKQRGAQLLAAGVHKISISLHSFEKDDPQAHLRYLQNIADFVDAAASTDTLISLRLWNQGYDDRNNDRTLAFLQQRLRGDWTPNTRGFRIRQRQFLEWGDHFDWPDKDAPLMDSAISCYGMRDQFGILCDGSVVPCCLDSDGVITLGNIFREELSDILSSHRATAIADGFRNRAATEDLCRRCGYARRFQ